MDTRASDHIVCSVSFFQSSTIVSHCVVELPNGESAHVFLIPLFLIMFFVFLLSHSIFCLSVNLLKDCLCVLCFYLSIVSFRIFHVRRRLEWVKSIMVCICYRRVLPGLHILYQIIFPFVSPSSQFFLLLFLLKTCQSCGILD